MNLILLRDHEAARQYLLQGLWLARAIPPGVATVHTTLEWTMTIADSGQPLPPIGFIADLGHIALAKDQGANRKKSISIPGFPSGLARTYEDHVLGKLYADGTFERASAALKRVPKEKQKLGLAYIIKQIRERADIGGVEMSPGVVRGLLDRNNKSEDLLRQGWDSLTRSGPMPILIEMYEQIITASRGLDEFLAREDVIALEQNTALLTMGEYVAHRQILQMAMRFEESLPKHRVKPLNGRREVPTRVVDEDTYPVGGFASISTRGSLESLLHSQLAYMERDKKLQPDLFDIKYLRDELYYYSRDENQFLRRRRSFLFILQPDLVEARLKDPELPCQRLVLALSLLLAAITKLTQWLNSDCLTFEFLLLEEDGRQPLREESRLLELLFRERIENKTVSVANVTTREMNDRIQQQSARSLCHCLVIGTQKGNVSSEVSIVTEMRITSARPHLIAPTSAEGATEDMGDPLASWTTALIRLLQMWV